MFSYYFNLALRSFKRNKALTVLMVLAIALGIGASMTTLTVFHVLSGDPIPDKSTAVLRALDPETMQVTAPASETQMTRLDAETLLDRSAVRQS
jgi:putative ABC transport system permease protein